jgi:hippurate hydrolase
MACTAVLQYQAIVSQQVPAQDVAVLIVGAINAGKDNNVIPTSATIKVNLRWFSEKTRNILLDGIRRINEGIAVSYNLPKEMYPTILMKGSAFPLDNDAALVGKVNAALEPMLGSRNIIQNTPSSMGSEDFQHLVLGNGKTTYDYIQVGVVSPAVHAKAIKEGKKAAYFYHSNNYMVELAALPLGTEVGATALMAAFKK